MRGTPSYFQGDIVLIPFPFSDQVRSKLRPAIVISNSKINKLNDDVLLAPITTTLRNDDFSFKIVDKDVTVSLRGESEIRCNKITTCEQSLITKKISALKADKISRVIELVTSCFKNS